MSRCPLLIVVTGPPASGKTTIARSLADDLSIPVFHKDEIKERLADEIPGNGIDWSRNLGSAAYALLYRVAGELVDRGHDCILEANFHAEFSIPALRSIAEGAQVIQVLCGGDPTVLEQRYRRRFNEGQRHPVHIDLDPERVAGFPSLFDLEKYRLDIPGPVIELDTTGSEPLVAAAIERVRSVLD